MVWIAAVNHFSNWASECDQDRLFVKLAWGELVKRPFDLNVGVAIRTVVTIWFDRNNSHMSADVDRHESVAGFVVSRDF